DEGGSRHSAAYHRLVPARILYRYRLRAPRPGASVEGRYGKRRHGVRRVEGRHGLVRESRSNSTSGKRRCNSSLEYMCTTHKLQQSADSARRVRLRTRAGRLNAVTSGTTFFADILGFVGSGGPYARAAENSNASDDSG